MDVGTDEMDALIYRNSYGTGTVNYTEASLKWQYGGFDLVLKEGYYVNDDGVENIYYHYDPNTGNYVEVTYEEAHTSNIPDNAINIEVKVMGIEMVYIPEGPFYIGDGVNGWRNGDNTDPYYVTHDGEHTFGYEAGQLRTHDNIGTGSISVDVNMGFEAFYTMKQKITQEQILDYINMLTRSEQGIQVGLTGRGGLNNWSLLSFPIKAAQSFASTGPVEFILDYNDNEVPNEANDGHNFVYTGWSNNFGDTNFDLNGYLTWSGLRKPTEFEYEKAARGPNVPIPNETPWGNSLIITFYPYNFDYDGVKGSGTETLAATQSSYPGLRPNYFYSEDGYIIEYLFRSGLFADGATNRVEAGASYYGVLEMGIERVINYGYAGSKGARISGNVYDNYSVVRSVRK